MLSCNWSDYTLHRFQPIVEACLIEFHQWVLARVEKPGKADVVTSIKRCLSDMESQGVMRALDIVWYFVMACALDKVKWYDFVYEVITDIVAWVDLYRECITYKKAGDGDGFNGPPRTIWEYSNSLTSGSIRASESKNRLMIYGLLKDKSK